MIRTKLLSLTFAFLIAGITSAQVTHHTRVQTGNWNTAGTWSIIAQDGADCGCVPASTDDAIIYGGHTITMSASSTINNLTINALGVLKTTNTAFQRVNGNYVLNGEQSGGGGTRLDFYGSSLSGNGRCTNSDWWYLRNPTTTLTFSSPFAKVFGGVVVLNVTVNNNGHFNLSGSSGKNLIGILPASSIWNNNAGATLRINSHSTVSSANLTLNASANPNTVEYGGTVAKDIYTTTYHNLAITQGTKSLLGDVSVNNNLSVSGGATLNYAGNDVNVGANLTNSGSMTNNTGKITLNGAVAQQIGGNAISFEDLEINNTFGGVDFISSNHTIAGTLTMTAGDLDANTQTITLTSNASNTSRIVHTGGTITGSYILECYMGGAAADWQDLSTPINGNMLDDWDNDPGFIMSGVNGNEGNASGGTGTFYSVKTYNEATGLFVDVSTDADATPLVKCKGYEIFVGDDTEKHTPFTFNSVGTPYYGNQTINVTNTLDGFNLIGNPYMSALSWTTLSGNNAATLPLTPSFYVMDETLGNYASSDGTVGTGKLTANPNVIPSHQGFWIQADAAGTFTFTEADKSTTATVDVYKKAPLENTIKIHLSNDQNRYGAENILSFAENAKNEFDPRDAVYLKDSPIKTAPNLMTFSTDNKKLMRNTLSSLDNDYTIELHTTAGVEGNYFLTAKDLDQIKDDFTCIVLEDLETGNIANLKQNNVYSYEVKEINRDRKFLLHMSRTKTGQDCFETLSSVEDKNLDELVKVYTNNTGAIVEFDFNESSNTKIQVLNALGQKVLEDKNLRVLNHKIQLDLPKTHTIYFITVETDKKTITKRLYY